MSVLLFIVLLEKFSYFCLDMHGLVYEWRCRRCRQYDLIVDLQNIAFVLYSKFRLDTLSFAGYIYQSIY